MNVEYLQGFGEELVGLSAKPESKRIVLQYALERLLQVSLEIAEELKGENNGGE